MAFSVNILAIGQEVDVESGDTTNKLIMQLPDGSCAHAIITSASAEKIVALIAQSKVTQGDKSWTKLEQVTFGGDYSAEEAAPPRAPYLGKDQFGYPILGVPEGTKDPNLAVGLGEQDELGVPSI